MKLNIGSGAKFLDGYINIDINPKLKVDMVMDAWDLKFDNETADEIMAIHLIEHLGFFKAKYFLSECYRVLKDSGRLLIETPHIERSFEYFLKAKDKKEREIVLSWIYGSESKYMNHIFCFPVELIFDLASEFGFNIEKVEYYDYEFLRPAVKYSMVKIKEANKTEKSLYRKKLILNKIPDLEDELKLAEIEKDIKSKFK
jgi:predicted SAM-dependent methyltransferase